MRAYPSPRSTRDTAGLQRLVTPVSRPNPVVIAWRWRYELLAAAGLAAVVVALVRTAGPAGLIAAAVIAAGLAALVGLWPPARRLATARAWCVITPHRIRAGCAEAWVQSRYGKIPVVLWTSARPFGERVWVWCRAGSTPDDLESARAQLAAACWASEVQIVRNPRFAHLAAIDVLRRAARQARGRRGPLRAAPRPLAEWSENGDGDRTRPLAPVGDDEHSDAA